MNRNYLHTLMLACAATLLVAGCASMGGGNSGATVVASGDHSLIKDQEYKDIHTQADFDALWDKAFKGMSGAPDKPQVDFSKQMVLAAFIGDQNTGGYTIRFTKIDSTGPTIDVSILVTQPGQNCRVPQRLSDTYLIVAIPASSKPVNINNPQSERMPACG
ncbi:MAG: protease complex subunit PrcB family protein [Gammaproteobacteria bacterium]|nr:protease complex subunit PrcB family protein [Gammaproteobacteria bacterium]MDE2345110.1 protease complex subunit PrcB family protein [Gammaproteobacteria bacterium]